MSRFFGEKQPKKVRQIFVVLFAILLLVSCVDQPVNIPISDKSMKGSYHAVIDGETLYSIAWRYSLDFRELAKTNAIEAPYTIRPGQRIYVTKKSLFTIDNKLATTKQSSYSKQQQLSPASSSAEVKKVPFNEKNEEKITDVIVWKWPSDGKLIRGYAAQNGLNKGIDISGKLGEPVVAAAPGMVVYAGSGLLGYGQLVIIKHNDEYLSAYAHNSRLFVKEGDVVRAEQKIAEVGSTGTDRTKLHFEIRKDGKPVDPLRYLSKR